MTAAPDTPPPYRHVAWAYDAIASIYSLGAIDRAKAFHHALVSEGDRVLYAGAGRGREIVGACQRGAEVTCVEACPVMALRLHDRLASHGERFTILPKPIQAVTPLPEYDLVVAHFFLNVFDAEAMPKILDHLCGFVKPDGQLILADFKPNARSDGRFTRFVRKAYYRPVNVAGWLLRICALHPNYDYAPFIEQQGFRVMDRAAAKSLSGLPPFYETIVAQKEPPSCDGG